MVVDTQLHKVYVRPFARVLYLFLIKHIGRWLPWVLPGATERFYKDDVVHNHSAHGYYITRTEGGVRYAWYCTLNRTKQNWAKIAIHIIRELDLVTFHMKDYLSDETSKIDVGLCKNSKTTGTWYLLPVNVAAGHTRGPAQGCGCAVSLDRTRMVNTIFSHHFFCSWYIWQSTFHIPVVEEVAGPRDICQAVLIFVQNRNRLLVRRWCSGHSGLCSCDSAVRFLDSENSSQRRLLLLLCPAPRRVHFART